MMSFVSVLVCVRLSVDGVTSVGMTSCGGGEDDGSGRGRGWVIEGDRCVCSLAPTLSSVAAVRLHDFHAAKNVPGV